MTNDYPALTVQALYELCKMEIKKGNREKKICISSDDEGNGFHGLFYGFNSDAEFLEYVNKEGLLYDNVDIKNIIILG